MLKLENLTASIGDVQILKGIDLEIKPGELHAIMGPNGSGKTTLINIICGIVRPSSGKVRRLESWWFQPQEKHFESLTQ